MRLAATSSRPFTHIPVAGVLILIRRRARRTSNGSAPSSTSRRHLLHWRSCRRRSSGPAAATSCCWCSWGCSWTAGQHGSGRTRCRAVTACARWKSCWCASGSAPTARFRGTGPRWCHGGIPAAVRGATPLQEALRLHGYGLPANAAAVCGLYLTTLPVMTAMYYGPQLTAVQTERGKLPRTGMQVDDDRSSRIASYPWPALRHRPASGSRGGRGTARSA